MTAAADAQKTASRRGLARASPAGTRRRTAAETAAAVSTAFGDGADGRTRRARAEAGRTKGVRPAPVRAWLRRKYSTKGSQRGAARPAPARAAPQVAAARSGDAARRSVHAPARIAAISAVSGWPPARTTAVET